MPAKAVTPARAGKFREYDCPLAATPGDHAVIYDRAAERWHCDRCGGGGNLDDLAELSAAQLDDLPLDDDPPLHLPEGFRLLSDVLDDPGALEPPRPVVPRLAWAGRVTLLAAREKLGKSTLASAAAAAVTVGADFLEGPCRGGRVLYVGLEEHVADLVARLRRFGVNPNQLAIADRLDHPMDRLASGAEMLRPALIVVDTLAAFVDGLVDDPSSSTAWTAIMGRLSRIARDTDVALLLLHHSRKSDGAYRDSSAIGAGVDVVIEMKPDAAEHTTRRLETKARFPVPETVIRLDPAGYSLVGAERSLDERVLDFVAVNPGCSKSQVRQGVSGKGATILETVDRLIAEGRLRNRGTQAAFKLYASEQRTGDRPGNGLQGASGSLEAADGIERERAGNRTGEPPPVPVSEL